MSSGQSDAPMDGSQINLRDISGDIQLVDPGAAAIIQIGLEQYKYKFMFDDCWRCACAAAGWNAALGVVLWMLLDRSAGSVIAFHAPAGCRSRLDVLGQGTPVFKTVNINAVLIEGRYTWLSYTGSEDVDEAWKKLGVFETKFLPAE